jgi:hypothetical protein
MMLSDTRLDENFKASAYLWETVSDPKTAKSGEPNEAPFSRAIGNGKTFWQWLEQPKNAFIQHRFDIAMSGIQALTSNAVILSGS